ncbi:hypothetical protein MNV49_001376 [Pseudohyphozyma bogoriensis]|nr:hypothetical protein MNV49_001376 [Pseudohyphozyma bogoriensis]
MSTNPSADRRGSYPAISGLAVVLPLVSIVAMIYIAATDQSIDVKCGTLLLSMGCGTLGLQAQSATLANGTWTNKQRDEVIKFFHTLHLALFVITTFVLVRITGVSAPYSAAASGAVGWVVYFLICYFPLGLDDANSDPKAHARRATGGDDRFDDPFAVMNVVRSIKNKEGDEAVSAKLSLLSAHDLQLVLKSIGKEDG